MLLVTQNLSVQQSNETDKNNMIYRVLTVQSN